MRSSARRRPLVTATLIAVSCLALVGWGGGRDDDRDRDHDGHHGKEPPLTVPKARCGPHDRPETGLQGQVPAALRAAGFKGFNCNLELIGQSKGDGGNWQSAQFRETRAAREHHDRWGRRHGHKPERVCGYHATASPTLSGPRANFGVRVLDLTEPAPSHTDRASDDHVDARSVGVIEGQRAAPAARGRQRTKRCRRTGSRYLRPLRRLPLSAAARQSCRSAPAPTVASSRRSSVTKAAGHPTA